MKATVRVEMVAANAVNIVEAEGMMVMVGLEEKEVEVGVVQPRL